MASASDVAASVASIAEVASRPNFFLSASSDSMARIARANIYLNRGDYAALDKDLDAILKAAPQDFRANYLRALEYLKKRDFAAADKILDRISPSFS